MNAKPSIVWFRQDLRLQDNPALSAALQRGGPVVPLYIWSPEEEGDWPPGAASRWWLHHSLQSLDRSLRERGSRLIVCRGSSLAALRSLIAASGADAVFWNRRYEPSARERDRDAQDRLAAEGVAVRHFNSALLFEPTDIANRNGLPFQVFTPFWKACLESFTPGRLPALPGMFRMPAPALPSLSIADLDLLPGVDWAAGLRASWQPGEPGASARLQSFVANGLARYPDRRDQPDLDGVSRLSPHLHFGEIGPGQIWEAIQETGAPGHMGSAPASGWSYLRQLGWREFAHHLLYHFPTTPEAPLRPEFADFPWQEDPGAFKAWQRGRTGYPLVDAGMRQLWTTGWMHNRVRMVVASYLVKDLLIPWQTGARWFWDTLVDADLANNTLGWQWTAGCGADAAPYFRIFNPVKQGEKFDPDGGYIRRWVPELRHLSAERIHHPWDVSAVALQKARTSPGKPYPDRIVDHSVARERALAAVATLRKADCDRR